MPLAAMEGDMQGKEHLPASLTLQCRAAAACRDLVRQETGASCIQHTSINNNRMRNDHSL